ncbi:fungal specific transcription factor domain-containing protein [Aspergillus affinis]|uniref:fungal specific transcription factor domain-containing protein n=1 Tax=Aspergillus affinis TaxID=1070780 RepID=UPI0022FE378C|nr:C6 transcription factor [Aspergillus affinis]KAI9037653.1 C6 transcription factor [Aspergillus affinis]
MQKSSAFIFPQSSAINGDQRRPQQLHPHHHPHHPHQQHAIIPSSSTRSGSISEIPAFADYPLMDDSSVSHRASISTDENSNDSPESWDDEGPDSSPVADVEVKIHDISHPLAMTSAKAFQFNMVAHHDSDLSMGDVTPKVEEVDDADDLQSIKPMGVDPLANADSTHPDSTALPVNVPRKRGRPRKHPLPAPGGQVKITKAAARCQTMISRALPFLIDGIESDIDRRFLDHFVYGFSRVLTLINDDSNPFKEILLPMATQHRGLMHSLMCLSGSHLSGLEPEPRVIERKYHHFHRAIRDLKSNITASSKGGGEEPELLVEDPIIASTIALSLNTICEGETNGEYRPHMDAARYLLVTQKPRNEKFRQFIVEFFQYHDVSNSITSLDRRPAHLNGDLRLPDFVPHAQAGMFLGVFDGLFNYISEVTRLRDRIRQRYNEGYEPAVDYQILSEAVSIDSAIRAWETSHPPNTPNWALAQLYRQSTWVYLYRTIRPSRPSEKIARVVDDGLAFLDQLPRDAGAYSIVLMPLFLLGCSAFVPEQRERIQKGFESLKAYSNLRNIQPALTVVEKVWEVMDSDIGDSWDWEKIIKSMNMDFLIT